MNVISLESAIKIDTLVPSGVAWPEQAPVIAIGSGSPLAASAAARVSSLDGASDEACVLFEHVTYRCEVKK